MANGKSPKQIINETKEIKWIIYSEIVHLYTQFSGVVFCNKHEESVNTALNKHIHTQEQPVYGCVRFGMFACNSGEIKIKKQTK